MFVNFLVLSLTQEATSSNLMKRKNVLVFLKHSIQSIQRFLVGSFLIDLCDVNSTQNFSNSFIWNLSEYYYRINGSRGPSSISTAALLKISENLGPSRRSANAHLPVSLSSLAPRSLETFKTVCCFCSNQTIIALLSSLFLSLSLFLFGRERGQKEERN